MPCRWSQCRAACGDGSAAIAARTTAPVLDALLVAAVAGFVVSMPVGPVAAVCVRQVLAHGALAGIVAAFGVALVDAAYAGAGIVGLHVGLAVFEARKAPIHIAAGVLLLALAVYFFRARTHAAAPRGGAGEVALPTLLSGFGATFVLSLPNPGPALVAAAIFSALGVAAPAAGAYAAVTASALAGAMLWWAIVVVALGRLPERFEARAFALVNIACAAALAAAGALSLATAL